MKELSKVEMQEVSGAGFLDDLFGDIAHAGDVAINSIANGFISTGKVFTDFVFNVVKGFNEGRYL